MLAIVKGHIDFKMLFKSGCEMQTEKQRESNGVNEKRHLQSDTTTDCNVLSLTDKEKVVEQGQKY